MTARPDGPRPRTTDRGDTTMNQPEPDDPTQCSGEEGFCPEHGFHRHTLKQPGTADAKPVDRAALRETIAETLLDHLSRTADIRPAASGELAFMPEVTDTERLRLADAVLAVLPPPADRAETERLRAERDSLGREADRLRTDWTAMRDRAERAKADRDWWRDQAHAVQARAERADRAAVYREAADVAERLMDERYGPDCSYGVGGRDVARELRRLADEAQQQPEADEERADREETERDHARGDHTYCGITCEVEMPTEHLRNFVIAKGYPGTKGALDELLRRAADAAQPQPAGARQDGAQQ